MSPVESMLLRGVFESGKYADLQRENEELAKRVGELED
jgi:hypothetical protein